MKHEELVRESVTLIIETKWRKRKKRKMAILVTKFDTLVKLVPNVLFQINLVPNILTELIHYPKYYLSVKLILSASI